MESIVEALADSKHGFAVFALGILVLLLTLVIIQVIKLVMGVYADRQAEKNKAVEKEQGKTDKEITEVSLALQQNTAMVREVKIKLELIERELHDLQRIKADSDSLFTAIKVLAGPKWEKISKAIQADKAIKGR